MLRSFFYGVMGWVAMSFFCPYMVHRRCSFVIVVLVIDYIQVYTRFPKEPRESIDN